MKPIRIQSFTIFNSIKTVQNKDLYAFGSLQITLSFQLKILQFVSTYCVHKSVFLSFEKEFKIISFCHWMNMMAVHAVIVFLR